MSYQTALTINEIAKEIHSKKYLLPAIQREFVWDTYQIEKLFDSLMRDYPISSFLFWKVSKERRQDYCFYEFLRDYHEKNNRHNPKADLKGDDDIVAVLDGQQRLTSIYIALKGSYAYKLPYRRGDIESSYPKRYLYLNIVAESTDEDMKYDFQFLTSNEAKNDKDHYWLRVGDMLDMSELENVTEFLLDKISFAEYDKEKTIFANKALSQLYKVIHSKPTISYYLEKSEELEKVLNIFIRINSGGTTLSYSDLLLSIATAQWQTKDAREEINAFVDEINSIGAGFNFNKDFVLKASLVLSGFKNIAFKVDNFNRANMLKIEENWDNLTKAIKLAVNLISSFGYSGGTLTSNNAIIPIAYYLQTIGSPESFVTSTLKIEDRKKVKKWLVLSLLKKVFGGQPDNVLRPICDIILSNSDSGFPLESIIEKFRGTNKTIVFSDEDIENLMFVKYGKADILAIFSLIYPSFDFSNHFHVDHIFPKSLFTQRKLRNKGVAEEDLDKCIASYNYMANLQLLDAIPNIEKRNKEFKEWLDETYSLEQDKKDFKHKHYIPLVNLNFPNFLNFMSEREKLLINNLKGQLTIHKKQGVINKNIKELF